MRRPSCRLTRRELAVSFALLLTLCYMTQAQTAAPTPSPTPSDDAQNYERRRIAPTVGTGGSVGGPTGLFTVYDSKTLQRHDFTFSFAYSNYDRSPGSVDISQVQFSFNYGLFDRIELFYSAELYRGIKVNDPQALSGFYLPNSQLFFGPNQPGSGPAFVLAPFNNRGLSGAIFRPANNQPFVQFPFVGQPSGNFNVTGAPPLSGVLGVQGVGGSNFGAANAFPGIGSAVGSILPGVVFSTRTVSGVTTPEDFTVAPSYIPDAPFINRLYGTSSLNSTSVGLKIRFRKGEPFTNFGVIPFYRFYSDKANSQSGFSMLQRGASPGGNLGDFGLIAFVGSRVAPYLNISANVGYIFNSNPTSSAFGAQKVTLLDRPDELTYGAAIDFPLFNPKFGDYQPIIEIRGTKYIGGRTPNAFETNPVELIAGTRYYSPIPLGILDNIGIGVAYRYQLNSRNDVRSSASTNPNTPSGNSNGFIFQIWFGRDRFVELPSDTIIEIVPLPQPDSSDREIVLPCPTDQRPRSGACPIPNFKRSFKAEFKDVKGNIIKFGNKKDELDISHLEWESTGGTRVTPARGSQMVEWDLTGATKGNYFLRAIYPKFKLENRRRVRVKGKDVKYEFMMTVKECDCEPIPAPVSCPTSITVQDSQPVEEGAQASFTVNVADPPASTPLSYRWTVSAGRIIGRDDASTITVDTTGLGGNTVTATVMVIGLDPTRCANTASGSVMVFPPIKCKRFDVYGAIPYNDEKARLDNFVIDLNSNPSMDAYVIAYSGGTLGRNIGTRLNPVRDGLVPAQYRIKRAMDYMKDGRGYGRQIRTLSGSPLSESTVELYICPANAQPSVSPGNIIQNPSLPSIESSRRLEKRRPRLKSRRRKLRTIRGS
jgi:hypothetical protein